MLHQSVMLTITKIQNKSHTLSKIAFRANLFRESIQIWLLLVSLPSLTLSFDIQRDEKFFYNRYLLAMCNLIWNWILRNLRLHSFCHFPLRSRFKCQIQMSYLLVFLHNTRNEKFQERSLNRFLGNIEECFCTWSQIEIILNQLNFNFCSRLFF